jgi:crotonobetainyl-CoA:carnitine CoA-transferase CaiB-like acyl-CoA transferase
VVPRLSGTPGNFDWLGERLGAQNDEIFGGLLDLSAAEIRALRADK